MFNILLAEDNEADARLIMEVFKGLNSFGKTIHWVLDGVEAMEFLRKQGRFSDSPIPDIVLLDLNMPRKDGRQVLFEVRNDEHLKGIPIIVFTTSELESDVVKSYALQCSGYIVKPGELDDLIDVLTELENFWFGVIRLPIQKSSKE